MLHYVAPEEMTKRQEEKEATAQAVLNALREVGHGQFHTESNFARLLRFSCFRLNETSRFVDEVFNLLTHNQKTQFCIAFGLKEED